MWFENSSHSNLPKFIVVIIEYWSPKITTTWPSHLRPESMNWVENFSLDFPSSAHTASTPTIQIQPSLLIPCWSFGLLRELERYREEWAQKRKQRKWKKFSSTICRTSCRDHTFCIHSHSLITSANHLHSVTRANVNVTHGNTKAKSRWKLTDCFTPYTWHMSSSHLTNIMLNEAKVKKRLSKLLTNKKLASQFTFQHSNVPW